MSLLIFCKQLCFRTEARGCVQDGVVLGADTRSTAGSTVADKNCEKIHYIAPNIYCCGAGTAADTENVTGTSSWLRILTVAPQALGAVRQ